MEMTNVKYEGVAVDEITQNDETKQNDEKVNKRTTNICSNYLKHIKSTCKYCAYGSLVFFIGWMFILVLIGCGPNVKICPFQKYDKLIVSNCYIKQTNYTYCTFKNNIKTCSLYEMYDVIKGYSQNKYTNPQTCIKYIDIEIDSIYNALSLLDDNCKIGSTQYFEKAYYANDNNVCKNFKSYYHQIYGYFVLIISIIYFCLLVMTACCKYICII